MKNNKPKRSDWVGTYSTDYFTEFHQPTKSGKEVNYTKIFARLSHNRSEYNHQRRNNENIFDIGFQQTGKKAGSNQMKEVEPKNLAESIIRAVEAGELANDPREKKGLRPPQIFGAKIGALRREQGLSLLELSERADIDENVLFATELGMASPMQVYKSLHTLGDALGDRYSELSRLLIQITLKM
jgi:hypothetical protein